MFLFFLTILAVVPLRISYFSPRQKTPTLCGHPQAVPLHCSKVQSEALSRNDKHETPDLKDRHLTFVTPFVLVCHNIPEALLYNSLLSK